MKTSSAAPEDAPVRPSLLECKALTNQLYRDFLGREADRNGLRDWAPRLESGDANAYDAAVVLQRSEEGLARFLEDLYLRALHRAADAVGRANWIGHLQRGTAPEEVTATVLASDECWLTHQGRTERWVATVFRVILRADPSTEALAKWVQLLVSHELTRRDMVDSLRSSPDYARSSVERIYRQVLGRPLDPDGATTAVALLAEQGSIGFGAVLAGSPEYFAKALRLSMPYRPRGLAAARGTDRPFARQSPR